MKSFLLIICLMSFSQTALSESVMFEHQGNRLAGKFLAAETEQEAKAVLVFVHGDGPMPHDAEGFYTILAEPLRQQGFAIFSWDKPGVGDSTGNWLLQSMADRQSEVRAAITLVQEKYGFSARQTGLVGFSQAGWVVPALAGDKTSIGFSVGIGFARNWLDQGRYFTRTRMQLEGKQQQEIQAELEQNAKGVAFLRQYRPYDDYVTFAGEDAMSADRYQFVLKNFTADASVDYGQIKVPTLLLWGENDLNVDAKAEYLWWQSQPSPLVQTSLIANGSHGMLKAEKFDTQTMSISQWLKLMWLEQDAFAPDFFPTLVPWLEQVVADNRR